VAGRGHEPNHRARWVAAKSYSKPGLSISPARLAQANSSASPFLLGAADIWVVQLSCGGESGRGPLGDKRAVSAPGVPAVRRHDLADDTVRLLSLAMAQRQRPINTLYFILRAMESCCRALFTCPRGLPLNTD